MEGITTVELARITPGNNPRKTFNKQSFEELRDNIREHGILVPLIVRPQQDDLRGFELVAGSRRYRAAEELKLPEVPVVVRKLSDDQVKEVQLIENAQREDLDPLDECEAYQALLQLPGYDVGQVAVKVGKSKAYVYARLAFSNLGDAAKKALAKGEILLGHARILAGLQPDDQIAAIKEGCRNYRGDVARIDDLEEWIDEHIHRQLKTACFDTEDATLLTGAGPCSACPKRTGFVPELFPNVKDSDTCTDPTCFEGKIGTHVRRIQEEHNAIRVTSGWQDSREKKGKDTPLSRDQWSKVAKSKRNECSDVVPAVDLYTRSDDFGKLIYACTNKRCKKHTSQSPYSAPSVTPKEKERRRAAKELARVESDWRERIVRSVYVKAGGSGLGVGFGPKERTLLGELGEVFIERLHYEGRKTLCGWLDIALAAEGHKRGHGFTDHGEALLAWFNGADLFPALTILSLAPAYQPSDESDDRLRKVAAMLGVDHASVMAELKQVSDEKTAKAKQRAEARAKAEKKKASTSKRAPKKATKAAAVGKKRKARSSTKQSAAAE